MEIFNSECKAQGGLWIRNLKNHNKVLKLQWLWRYSQDPQNLWSKVIKPKYGEEDNWMTKPVNTTVYQVTMACSKESNFWQCVKWNQDIFLEWQLVWEWSSEGIIPDIYDLFQHQQKSIAEMWSPQGWELILRRSLYDWEMNRMIELYQQLESFTGLQNGDDKDIAMESSELMQLTKW